MRAVAAQIRQSFGLAAPLVQIARSGPPVTVDLDRAVPLGLLVSEVLSGALERSEDAAAAARIDIEDYPTDDDAHFVEIAIKGVAMGTATPESGLANRLISAYLAQLNASLQRTDDKIAIVFAIEAGLASAPNRMEIDMA
jgi:two-component sensor histidine kinase